MYVHFPPFAGLVAKQVDTTAALSVGGGGDKTNMGGGQRSVVSHQSSSRQVVKSSVVSHPVGMQGGRGEIRTRIG